MIGSKYKPQCCDCYQGKAVIGPYKQVVTGSKHTSPLPCLSPVPLSLVDRTVSPKKVVIFFFISSVGWTGKKQKLRKTSACRTQP